MKTPGPISNQLLQARMLSRKFVMQALYQCDLTGMEDKDSEDLVSEFSSEPNFSRADIGYFRQLLEGCRTHADEIEELANKAIDDALLTQVDPIEKALIRSAIYEIVFLQSTDRAIIISEAVRLSKKFGSTHGFRFVNGVLDKISAD